MTNLSLVRTLVAIAETGSFTAAGRTLGVPTSSVSRSLARLEAELGTRLVDRTTRRVSLTAAGRVYCEHASVALEAMATAETQVGELLGTPSGDIRMTIPVHLDGGFLARELVKFADANPRVRLFVEPTNRTVDLVADGYDVALRVQQQSVDSSLVVRELGTFHAWLVATPSYLAEHGTPRRPADLARHRCVNLPTHAFELTLLGPRGPERVRVEGPIAANDMHFARQLVEQGAGIGPLIFSPGDAPQLSKSLVRVLPKYVVAGPKLYVVTTSRKNQPLAVKRLRAQLIDAYARAVGPLASRTSHDEGR